MIAKPGYFIGGGGMRKGLIALSWAVIALQTTVARAQTTVLVVWHAEKAAAPAADPPLTKAGEARARVLADTARAHHVSVIFTTQYTRTKQTAAPAARALGITPIAIPANEPGHIQEVAAAVQKHPGATVLVVDHSNTIPALIAALGAKGVAPICDAEYDNLYVVRVSRDGKATVTREHYGVRTPVPANCASMR